MKENEEIDRSEDYAALGEFPVEAKFKNYKAANVKAGKLQNNKSESEDLDVDFEEDDDQALSEDDGFPVSASQFKSYGGDQIITDKQFYKEM